MGNGKKSSQAKKKTENSSQAKKKSTKKSTSAKNTPVVPKKTTAAMHNSFLNRNTLEDIAMDFGAFPATIPNGYSPMGYESGGYVDSNYFANVVPNASNYITASFNPGEQITLNIPKGQTNYENAGKMVKVLCNLRYALDYNYIPSIEDCNRYIAIGYKKKAIELFNEHNAPSMDKISAMMDIKLAKTKKDISLELGQQINNS